jgi:hypothetical protein
VLNLHWPQRWASFITDFSASWVSRNQLLSSLTFCKEDKLKALPWEVILREINSGIVANRCRCGIPSHNAWPCLIFLCLFSANIQMWSKEFCCLL